MQIGDRNIILVFFLILILVVLGFTGLLIVSDFQMNFVDSLVSTYEVSGRQSVHKIEYSLRYGKPLENFYGIEETLQEVKQDLPEVSEVQIISTDGQVMYDTKGQVEDRVLPEKLQKLSNFGYDSETNYSYGTNDGYYHVFLPIQGQNSEWQGSFQIIFPEDIINSHVTEITTELVIFLIFMSLIGLLVLILLSKWIKFINADGKVNRKNFLVTTMVLLGIIQFIFGFLNYTSFRDEYQKIAQDNASNVSNVINNDIESVLNLGVSYHQLYGLENYLANITDSVPEIGLIRLNSANEVLYSSEDALSYDELADINLNEKDSSMIHLLPMIEDNEQNTAFLEVVLSEDYFAQRMQNILLDSMTVLLLSVILMIEIILFMVIILQWNYDKKGYSKKSPEELSESISPVLKPRIDNRAIRMLVLIVGAAVFMSASFIPLRMQELYDGAFLGMSKDMILGLPISAEMLFAAIAAILVGKVIVSKGWYFSLLLGMIIFGGGLFLSYYAVNSLTFVIARAITGAGYGSTLLAIRGYIVNEIPSEEERKEIFPNYVSGIYAGFIVGTVTGGMLADRLGFAQVFLVALGLCIVALLFVVFLLNPRGQLKNQMNQSLSQTSDTEKLVDKNGSMEENEGSSLAYGVFSFLINPRVLIFFVLVVLPLTISSMFVDYYFPIFAAAEGATTSNVGRAFMLNGFAIAYLGPFLSRHAENKLGSKKALLASGILISGALILFYNVSTLAIAFFVVVMIGVSESFGLVAQNNYFVELRDVKYFGESKALGYYENVRKLGQMMGPLVFGSVLTLGMMGVGIIGITTLALIVLFAFVLTKRN
ncbi:MFS transporter [Natranaerofaba carboxydovora]|uniref:MFS transporter n=1 Tax=Natranaerofaba carboxydovora TaxID=2742683 RepID=UPI001F14779E|nr:MFS transporter [Natranaerofaba carboxydovora]UMZ72804.1 Major Facilitator Superfamily protein [Natranaerofaba carboxydovora]